MLIERLLGKKKDIEPRYDDTRWLNIAERPIDFNRYNQDRVNENVTSTESRTKYRKK